MDTENEPFVLKKKNVSLFLKIWLGIISVVFLFAVTTGLIFILFFVGTCTAINKGMKDAQKQMQQH